MCFTTYSALHAAVQQHSTLYALQHYTVLYCALLLSLTILSYTTLFCTILEYYTVLHYTFELYVWTFFAE